MSSLSPNTSTLKKKIKKKKSLHRFDLEFTFASDVGFALGSMYKNLFVIILNSYKQSKNSKTGSTLTVLLVNECVEADDKQNKPNLVH